MQENNSYEDDWKDEAPILAGLNLEDEGELPEGYFENLPTNVMDRIRAIGQLDEPADSVSETIAIHKPNWNRFWAIAASFALLVSIGIYLVVQKEQSVAENIASDSGLNAEISKQLALATFEDIGEALALGNLQDEELFAALDQRSEREMFHDDQIWNDPATSESIDALDPADVNWDDLNIDLSDLY